MYIMPNLQLTGTYNSREFHYYILKNKNRYLQNCSLLKIQLCLFESNRTNCFFQWFEFFLTRA